jgi:lysozyme
MEFCYLRAGRGKPSPPSTDGSGLDLRWDEYAPAAQAAGLQVGGYWRFYPSVELAGQVQAFCDRLNGQALTLPPMVDVEDDGGLPPRSLTDWALWALTSVHMGNRSGVRPVFYTGRWFLANALEGARLAQWPLALAAWTTDPTWPDERATFWQHAGDVAAPWASGRVDLQRRR